MWEIQHKFAHANGIRIHYAEAGSGPLVLFCHGFPESWYSWRHQLRALADAGFRAVAPDQRGYGDSDAPQPLEAYDLCHLSGDIVGLLYALGEECAVIVGHDWGSPIASTCALLRPDIFRAVALLSVPFFPRLFGGRKPTDGMRAIAGEMLEFYQLYFQQPGVPEAELEQDVRRSLLGMYYSASAEAPPGKRWRTVFGRSERFIDSIPAPNHLPSWLTEDDLRYYTQQFTKSGFRGPVNWYRNMDRNAASLSALKNALVRQPSLFLAGDQDGVIDMYREAYNSLETSMPNLRKKVLIPGSGHWVQQEQPALVNELLIEFCRAIA